MGLPEQGNIELLRWDKVCSLGAGEGEVGYLYGVLGWCRMGDAFFLFLFFFSILLFFFSSPFVTQRA